MRVDMVNLRSVQETSGTTYEGHVDSLPLLVVEEYKFQGVDDLQLLERF